jgi:hypothetical protein
MKFRQKCECTCNKPKLLHLPCSHVLAACRMLQLDPISFVARYYLKEVMLNTWNGEIWGFQAIGNFNTVNPDERQYIPDPSLVRTNEVDDSAGAFKMIWMNPKPVPRQSNVSYAICGAIGTLVCIVHSGTWGFVHRWPRHKVCIVHFLFHMNCVVPKT